MEIFFSRESVMFSCAFQVFAKMYQTLISPSNHVVESF